MTGGTTSRRRRWLTLGGPNGSNVCGPVSTSSIWRWPVCSRPTGGDGFSGGTSANSAIHARSSSLNLVPSPTVPSHIDSTHHRRGVATTPETKADRRSERAGLASVADEQRDRRAGWLTMVTLLPLVVVGVGLTASIYGAVFGIPLLALVARPWWAATRSVQRHRPLGTTALGHTVLAIVMLTGAVAVSVLLWPGRRPAASTATPPPRTI